MAHLELPTGGVGRDGARWSHDVRATDTHSRLVVPTPAAIYDIPSDFKPRQPTLTDILDAAATVGIQPTNMPAGALIRPSSSLGDSTTSLSSHRRRRASPSSPTDRSPWLVCTTDGGPARYQPRYSIVEVEHPQPGFTRAARFMTHSAHGTTQELSNARQGIESPGPKYNIRDVDLGHVRHRAASYSFGTGNTIDGGNDKEDTLAGVPSSALLLKDRLAYLLREQMSPTSPSYRPQVGPGSYSPDSKQPVISASRSSKQRRFLTQKNLNYISPKHNRVRFGLFSPGPAAHFPKSQTIESNVSATKKADRRITSGPRFAVPHGDFQLDQPHTDRSCWLAWDNTRSHATTQGHEPIPIESRAVRRIVSPGPASHSLPTGVGPTNFFVAESIGVHPPTSIGPKRLLTANAAARRSPSPSSSPSITHVIPAPPSSSSSARRHTRQSSSLGYVPLPPSAADSMRPSTTTTMSSSPTTMRRPTIRSSPSPSPPSSAQRSVSIAEEPQPSSSASVAGVPTKSPSALPAASPALSIKALPPTIDTRSSPSSPPTSVRHHMMITPISSLSSAPPSFPASAPAHLGGGGNSNTVPSGNGNGMRSLISSPPASARRYMEIHDDDDDDDAVLVKS